MSFVRTLPESVLHQPAVVRHFAWQHLLESEREVPEMFGELVERLCTLTQGGRFVDRAEYEAGFRKLLEARDCFVRAAQDYGGEE